jgi:hypothetical protein
LFHAFKISGIKIEPPTIIAARLIASLLSIDSVSYWLLVERLLANS